MIGLQSRLLGMDVLGFHQVLAITGDPSKIGDFPGATSVYDATSFKLLELIKQLNKGIGYLALKKKQPLQQQRLSIQMLKIYHVAVD